MCFYDILLLQSIKKPRGICGATRRLHSVGLSCGISQEYGVSCHGSVTQEVNDGWMVGARLEYRAGRICG